MPHLNASHRFGTAAAALGAALALGVTAAVTAAVPASAAVPAGTADQDAPGRPGTPVVTALAPTSATISWRAAPGGPGVTYDIWRVTDTGNGFYASTGATTYTFAWLTPGTRYAFLVATAGASWLPSGTVTFRTPPAPDESEPPSRPGEPAVTGVTDTTAVLTWAASTDNVAVTDYVIYRTLDGAETPLSASLTATATLRSLMPDMEYTVRVAARDATRNESPPSPPVTFRTAPDAASACAFRYQWQRLAGGTARGTVTFVSTGVPLDGWTLRITLPPGVRVLQGGPRWYQRDADAVFWHQTGGDYGLPRGGSDRAVFDAAGPDPGPVRVALNGHPCTEQPVPVQRGAGAVSRPARSGTAAGAVPA